MKKLFGVFMSSRKTEIVDYEIDDNEEFEDEIFSNLSTCLKEEKRLLKRFYDFCEEYNNFEFDEMGINMNEADDILRKSNKIRDLILSNIEEKSAYVFDDIQSDIVSKSFSMKIDLKQDICQIIIEVQSDSFNLALS